MMCGTVSQRIRIDFGDLFWLRSLVDIKIVRSEQKKALDTI
jgi:hypothetical protein